MKENQAVTDPHQFQKYLKAKTDSRHHDHLVHFYDNESELARSVVSFMVAGLMQDEGAIIIATKSHRQAFVDAFVESGLNVSRLIERRQLIMLDAGETLSHFMVDGIPDPNKFRTVIGTVLDSLEKSFSSIKAYGEMVGILWDDGNVDGTILLEQLWNDFGKERSFSLLCGYSTHQFKEAKQGVYFDQICKEHSHVVPAQQTDSEGYQDKHFRVIAQLQQRERALKNEITERKRFESEFLAEQALKDAILDNSEDCIKILDLQGKIQFMNRGGLKKLGLESFADLDGASWFDFWKGEHLANARRAFESAALGGRGQFTGMLAAQRQLGESFWNVTTAAIRSPDVKVTQILVTSRDVTEQVKTQQELEKRRSQQNEDRFRLIVETIKDYAIFLLDPEGRVSTWNQGAKNIKGYEASDIVGRHFSEFYTEEEKFWKPKMELEVASKVGRFEDEGWRIRKDGSRFWANVVITKIVDERGTLIGFAKVTRDLTERKRSESALKALNESLEQRVDERTRQLTFEKKRLQNIFANAPISICIQEGPEHVYLLQNTGYTSIVGGRNVIGQSVRAALPELEGQGFYELLDEVYRTGIPYRGTEMPAELLQEDGTLKKTYFDFIYDPWTDENGNVRGILTLATDVTSRVEAKKAAEESEAQFQRFAESMPQLAWIAKPDGFIFWYNKRWYDYTGKTPAEIEGWGWQSVHHPDNLPSVLETWRASIASGQVFEMEFPLRGADGVFRWFLTRVVPVRDKNGKIIRWFGTNTNIDAQVKMREELARALNIREEFLSIASHELKTPLTSLKLQLQLMERSADPDQGSPTSSVQIFSDVKTSLRQVDSLNDLVEDLLDTSKIQSGKFNISREEMNLTELVKEIVSRFAEQLNAAQCGLRLDLDADVIGKWDDRRLAQVVSNLVSNAIKYAPKSMLFISLSKSDKKVTLTVQDSGPGIPKARQATIFDRFERVSPDKNIGGLGLGLFIVKSIVLAHNGNIRVEGDEGEGTKFVIELPSDGILNQESK